MAEQDRITVIEKDLSKYPAILDLYMVAEILGISRKTAEDLKEPLKAYPLDPTKQRKQYRVNKADLIAYIIKSK